MFLSKRANGIYHLFYEQPNGKLTSISTKTKLKSEALKFLTKFSSDYEKRLKEKSSTTLKKFSFEFLKYSETVHSPKTYRDYKSTFNFFQKYFGDIPLSQITTKDMNSYLQHRISSASVYQGRKDLINLSSAFNRAVAEKYISENPCRGIKRIKPPEKQPVYYTKEEFSRLIEKIDDMDIRDLAVFSVNTGLRQMEALTLEWSQVDLEGRFLILNNQSHITKSRKVRAIPLNQDALEVLNRRFKIRGSELVFTINNNPIKQDYLIHKFRKYIDNAKLSPEQCWHSLRHSFASWLVQEGADINHVSKLLGHADIKTTEIYAHLLPENLRSSVELLNKSNSQQKT